MWLRAVVRSSKGWDKFIGATWSNRNFPDLLMKFRPLPAHKDSVQSTTLNEGSTSSIFYADPNLLLPSIGDNMTEGGFIVVLESILTRIENAVEVTAGIHKLPADDSSRSAAALLEALRDEGVDTLDYISSVLDRL